MKKDNENKKTNEEKKNNGKGIKKNIEKNEKIVMVIGAKRDTGGGKGGGQCCQSPSAKIHKGHSHTFSVAVLPFSTFPKVSLTRGVDIVAV